VACRGPPQRGGQAGGVQGRLLAHPAVRRRFTGDRAGQDPLGADRQPGGVDLWLCGHVHKYLRFDPAQGKNRYQLLLGTPETLIRVHVTPGQLKLSVNDSAGRVVDTLTVAARIKKQHEP